MREVRRAVLYGPVLHGDRDGVGHVPGQLRAALDRVLKGLKDRLGQALAADVFVEDVFPVNVLDGPTTIVHDPAAGGGLDNGLDGGFSGIHKRVLCPGGGSHVPEGN